MSLTRQTHTNLQILQTEWKFSPTFVSLTCQHLQRRLTDRGTRGQVRTSEEAGVSGLILEPTDNNNNQLFVNVREQQQSLRQPVLQFQPRAHSGLSPDVGGPASQFSMLKMWLGRVAWWLDWERIRTQCVHISKNVIKKPSHKKITRNSSKGGNLYHCGKRVHKK